MTKIVHINLLKSFPITEVSAQPKLKKPKSGLSLQKIATNAEHKSMPTTSDQQPQTTNVEISKKPTSNISSTVSSLRRKGLRGKSRPPAPKPIEFHKIPEFELAEVNKPFEYHEIIQDDSAPNYSVLKTSQDEKNYHDMVAKLAAFIDKAKPFQSVAEAITGNIYGVISAADDSLYRCSVVSVAGLDVTCFLLDFGSYETVNFDKMRHLNQELASIKVSTINLALTGEIPENRTVFVKSISVENCIPTHHVELPEVKKELVGNPAPILPPISHYPTLSTHNFTLIEAYFHTNSDGFTMSKTGHDFYKGKLPLLKNAPTIDVKKQYVEKNSVVAISTPDGFFRIKVTEVMENSEMVKFMYLDCPEWPNPEVHEISLSQVYVLPDEYSLKKMPNDNVFVEVTADFENKVSEEKRMLFWEKKKEARCKIQKDTVLADFFEVETVSHGALEQRNFEKAVVLGPKYLCLGAENYENIKKIEQDLEKSELVSKKFIRLFEPCILKSEGKFLRAVCTKKEADKLTLYCYDHGDKIKAVIDDVFEMPEEFLKREVFVVCCDSENFSPGEVVNVDQIQKVSENKDHINYPCRIKAFLSKIEDEILLPVAENDTTQYYSTTTGENLFTVGQLECPFNKECIWLINSEQGQKFNDWWIAIYESGKFDPWTRMKK